MRLTDEIFLDIDVDYEEFIKNHFDELQRQIDVVEKQYNITTKAIRKSSSGRVHIALVIPGRKDLDIVNQFDLMSIRAFLGDDEARILADLRRYFISRDYGHVNRIFDHKFKKGKAWTAGPWVMF